MRDNFRPNVRLTTNILMVIGTFLIAFNLSKISTESKIEQLRFDYTRFNANAIPLRVLMKNDHSNFIFQNDVFFKIYIDYPRPKLIERIASRSEQMLKDGAINEVKRFLKLKIKKDNSSNKVIGIAEIKEHLENKLDLKEVHEKITIKTRQYAKRQSTWARGQMSSWNKINSKDLKKFLKKI